MKWIKGMNQQHLRVPVNKNQPKYIDIIWRAIISVSYDSKQRPVTASKFSHYRNTNDQIKNGTWPLQLTFIIEQSFLL